MSRHMRAVAAFLLAALLLSGCDRAAAPTGQKETASGTAGGGQATGPTTGPATGPATAPGPAGSESTPGTGTAQPPKPTTAPKPITYDIESAPDQAGPWSPLARNRWLPDDHRWLRFEFSGPMVREPRAQWSDDQTAIVRIEPAARVIPTGGWKAADPDGAVINWAPEAYVYRGPRPQLMRAAPGGAATAVHTLGGVPERLDYTQGRNEVRYQLAPVSYWIDVQTGAIRNDGSMFSGGHDYGEVIFWSPDRAWKAEVPGLWSDDKAEVVTLIIAQGNQELYRLEQWLPFRRGSRDCSFGSPQGAWRPDGKYLAITARPEPDRAELWVLDRTTRKHTVASQLTNPGCNPIVSWSPDGRYLTFGSTLLGMTPEGATARTISTQLGQKLFWRGDSRYLLTSQAHTYRWGRLLLIEAETGKAQDLGYGWPLGFTAGGEALYVSWESSREY